VRRAVGERRGDVRRGDDGESEIDGLGDIGKAGIDFLAPQLGAAGIDEIDFRGEAAEGEIVVDRFRPAVAAFVRRADDGDRLRPQQGFDGTEHGRHSPRPVSRGFVGNSA
jgi:hypothetical protein